MSQASKKQKKATASQGNNEHNLANRPVTAQSEAFSLSTPIVVAMFASTVALMMLTATLYFPQLYAVVQPFVIWSFSPPHIRSFEAKLHSAALPAAQAYVPSPQHQAQYLWGTYRPHLFFGMRTRVGLDAVLTGLMWYRGVPQQMDDIRHVAKDGIQIRWEYHNGRSFGKQVIEDKKIGLNITASFIKEDNGRFSVRIEGSTKRLKQEYTLLYYVGIENQIKSSNLTGSRLRPSSEGSLEEGHLVVKGDTPATGKFSFLFPQGVTFATLTDQVSNLEERLPRLFVLEKQKLAFPPRTAQSDEASLFLTMKTFTGAESFNFDVFYYPEETPAFDHEASIALTAKLNSAAQEFEREFEEKFSFSQTFDEAHQRFGRIALSNLMGGIGYFYGRNRIRIPLGLFDSPLEVEAEGRPGGFRYSENKALFTCTPSRAYFPRGFVWDEGFHQMLVSAWDPALSRDMITHWLSLVQPDGWLAREQILGIEAERRVPFEFITQFPDHGNPPVLHLAVSNVIDRGHLTKDDTEFLRASYPPLLKNFVWFLKTQTGERPLSFRWRGAKEKHTLTCGLDDYPRFLNRTQFEEHVDLLSWIVLASSTLKKISRAINVSTQEFDDLNSKLMDSLARHWSEKTQTFADYESNLDEFSPHIGYASLFPFLFGLVPHDSPKLEKFLHILTNTRLLNSTFGIRSLSRHDKYFGKDENYWRGPVWINVNFLTLRALSFYYTNKEGPYQARCQDLYTQLRKELIANVYRGFESQNDYFENYNSLNGKGSGHHPFAGWTSLIVLIMAEKY